MASWNASTGQMKRSSFRDQRRRKLAGNDFGNELSLSMSIPAEDFDFSESMPTPNLRPAGFVAAAKAAKLTAAEEAENDSIESAVDDIVEFTIHVSDGMPPVIVVSEDEEDDGEETPEIKKTDEKRQEKEEKKEKIATKEDKSEEKDGESKPNGDKFSDAPKAAPRVESKSGKTARRY